MGTDIHSVFQKYDQLSKKWIDVSHRYDEDRHYQLFSVLAGVRNGFGFGGVVTGEPVQPIAPDRGFPKDFVVLEGCDHPVPFRVRKAALPSSRVTQFSPEMQNLVPEKQLLVAADCFKNKHLVRYLRGGVHCGEIYNWATFQAAKKVALKRHYPGKKYLYYTEARYYKWMGEHSSTWLSGEEMLAWRRTAPTVCRVGVLSKHEYERWDGVSIPDSYCGDVWGNNVVIINDNAVEMRSTPNWTHVRCSWDADLGDVLGYFFDEVERLQRKHGKIRFVCGFDS